MKYTTEVCDRCKQEFPNSTGKVRTFIWGVEGVTTHLHADLCDPCLKFVRGELFNLLRNPKEEMA